MTSNIVYVVTVGVLFATGVTMLLERSLTRVLMGVILVGNGVNLLILSGGRLGDPPIAGLTPEDRMSDPLPQAMILTAIVITLGMSAFLLAMAYRSWQLVGHDEVRDDVEDRRIMLRAERDQGLDSGDGDSDTGPDIEPNTGGASGRASASGTGTGTGADSAHDIGRDIADEPSGGPSGHAGGDARGDGGASGGDGPGDGGGETRGGGDVRGDPPDGRRDGGDDAPEAG